VPLFLGVSLDFVQPANRVKRLLCQLALIGYMQVEGLAARMGHAADFRDAQLEAGFVAGEVIADKLAVPSAQEVTRMFAGTAGAEVVDHGLEGRERRAAVGPDIRAVGFLLAGCQHLYRRFIGVDDSLGQYCFSQRINQRLKLHAGLTHPLRQCRARDGQAGTAKDLFLPIQRQVVGELGHHHMSQQAGSGDALVDQLRRHRGLDAGRPISRECAVRR